MQIVNTHEAKTHLSKLLVAVMNGQEVIIGKAGTPVAKLVPFKKTMGERVGGQLAGKIKIADDFDKLPKKFIKHFTL